MVHYAFALPATAPMLVVPIAVAMTASTFPSVVITVTATASKDITETRIAIRSATIPTTITRVVAVHKLLALLIEAATSASTLAHSISRHTDK